MIGRPETNSTRRSGCSNAGSTAATLFASLLGLNRAFAAELENDTLSALALAPADRGWIWLGKAAANGLLIGIVQVVTAGVFTIVFDLALPDVWLPFAGVLVLGNLGLAAVGTLLGAVAVRTRYRDVMLPLLLFPLLVPVLIGAVEATHGLLADGVLPAAPVELLAVVDAVYLIVSFIAFEYVLDE